VDELVGAQARRALERLHSVGWAVGPPIARDDWRRAVRAEARRIGLRVRTGESRGRSSATDGELHPWAMTVEGYAAMRAAIGGLDLSSLGSMVVTAATPTGTTRAEATPILALAGRTPNS
jgi:hypothetical protein